MFQSGLRVYPSQDFGICKIGRDPGIRDLTTRRVRTGMDDAHEYVNNCNGSTKSVIFFMKIWSRYVHNFLSYLAYDHRHTDKQKLGPQNITFSIVQGCLEYVARRLAALFRY